jgi:hypothetical protein
LFYSVSRVSDFTFCAKSAPRKALQFSFFEDPLSSLWFQEGWLTPIFKHGVVFWILEIYLVPGAPFSDLTENWANPLSALGSGPEVVNKF